MIENFVIPFFGELLAYAIAIPFTYFIWIAIIGIMVFIGEIAGIGKTK